MNKWLRMLLLVALLVATQLRISLADTANPEEVTKLVEAIAVPQSPAFAVLGVTPDKVVRPGNVRELAVGLIQGVDERGNLQNGVALDFTPYLLISGDDLTLTEYRKSRMSQFLSHVQLSLATAKGQDVNDKSERLAAGLRATIFDFGDPRMDTKFDDCVKQAHDSAFNAGPIPPTASAEEIAQRIKEKENAMERAVKVCREKHAESSIGAPALDIGISPLWISEDGQSKNLKGSGIAAWSSYKMGFGRLLAIANVQYKSQDKVPDPAQQGNFLQGPSVAGGLKARYGSAASAFIAQGVYTNYSPEGKPKEENAQYSIGGEIKLADNLWLELSVGETRNKQGDENSFVTSQFKWGLSENAVINKK